MKVLAIEGSPRKGGNSDVLLDSLLKGAQDAGCDVEKIYVSRLNIAPCDEGNSCHKTGKCHINDDMQAVYDKLLSADCLIVSSPTFFMGPPAQLKAVIDRCQALWAKKFVLKKPLREVNKERAGYLLATAGFDKEKAFVATKEIVKAFFFVLDFKYTADIFVGGVDKKGDIDNKKSALDKAYKLGSGLKEN